MNAISPSILLPESVTETELATTISATPHRVEQPMPNFLSRYPAPNIKKQKRSIEMNKLRMPPIGKGQ